MRFRDDRAQRRSSARRPLLVLAAAALCAAALSVGPLAGMAYAGENEPLGAAAPAEAPSDHPAPRVVYVVQPGDTLSLIARRYGTRVEALVAANSIVNDNFIRAGQLLFVPVLPAAVPPSIAQARKGLAMAVWRPDDLSTLDAGWYFTWAWCEAHGCVPMVYEMQPPPRCPALLLVGNEPNAVPPFGGPVTPQAAVQKVAAIERQCPETRLVVGNVAADDWSEAGGWGDGHAWLRQFMEDYRALNGRPFRQALGVHCYSRFAAAYCVDQLARLRALYAGPMWVTEFGVLSGDARQFERLLAFVTKHFDRYAAYTNRQPHTAQGWELDTGVELIRPDGNLTAAGEVFAGW